MEEINNIHWHDCELEAVIEIPSQDRLVLNVQYPKNWENNTYMPKGIVFGGYHSQEVREMPFEGNPTILDASVVSEGNGYKTVKIETNTGYRLVTAKSVSLGERIESI